MKVISYLDGLIDFLLESQIIMIPNKRKKIINGNDDSFNVEKIDICARAGILQFPTQLKIKISYSQFYRK